jgi:ubiquinone biosynthesis protein Coq4
LKALAALWLHAAAAAPEHLPAIYDASAEGWLGEPVGGPAIRTDTGQAPAPIAPAFWQALWSLLAEASGALGATSRTAALGSLTAPGIDARVARAALAYPGVQAAAAHGPPRKFTLAALADCPPDSLGAAFHSMIVDQGLDLEGVDETAGSKSLPAPLDYLNARIAQCRGLWRLTAGYETTALHDMALCAFQLGQFGHHDSAKFLGMVLTRVAFEQPAGGPLILQTILTAWAHGRRTPPLIGVKWESLWAKPIEAVRAELGVTPYASPFPADIFERAAA